MTNFPSIWGKTHLLNENDEINDSAVKRADNFPFFKCIFVGVYCVKCKIV